MRLDWDRRTVCPNVNRLRHWSHHCQIVAPKPVLNPNPDRYGAATFLTSWKLPVTSDLEDRRSSLDA